MHLRAAEGWLDLGNFVEASAELEKIPPRLRRHTEVLEVQWQLAARTGQWEECLNLSKAIIKRAPNRASGWINFSFALHELKRTQEAWDSLFAVVEKFPLQPTIAYNLACYAAQLGRSWEAEQWLRQAFKVGEAKVLKPMALADPDLEPLGDQIADF